jgi:hypothetical protein
MSYRLVVFWIIMAITCSSVLFGQLTSAIISGRVTDSTGADTPKASVTATDSTTGAVFHAENQWRRRSTYLPDCHPIHIA